MEVTENVSVLRGELRELMLEFYDGSYDQEDPEARDPHGTLNEVSAALKGEAKINPHFRIHGGSGFSDVFFNNRELLGRWASMPTLFQTIVLRVIRRAFVEKKVGEIEVTIMWSKNKKRKLRIKTDNAAKLPSIDFELI